MARIHLFEFEDFRWFPGFLRNYMTDFLQFVSNRFDIYRDVVPLLSEAIRRSAKGTIVDLASGGGGGLVKLAEHLRTEHPQLKIVLTDFYPNMRAFERTTAISDAFTFHAHPVDARNVPAELDGVRTQFLSLHHFRPDDAVKILQNAVDSGNPLALFESQQRDLKSIISMIFSPVSVLLATPFIRPFSAGRIVFTYLVPLVPLFILWDGVVSALRTYSVKEMNALIARVNGRENYEWNVGVQKTGPGGVPYLTGWKKV
jgi:SAM-dependent methyltransferase